MMKKLSFEVQGRNGQYMIDQYTDGNYNHVVTSFKTRKKANDISSELNILASDINVLTEKLGRVPKFPEFCKYRPEMKCIQTNCVLQDCDPEE